MGLLTKIQWCDHTWNPWRGCAKPPAHEDGSGIAPECFFCYAEAGAKRNPNTLGRWGKQAHRAVGTEWYWQFPLRWAEQARKDGVRRRVFFSSLADVFEDRDDLAPLRERAFQTIDLCPELDFLVLTKRPEVVTRLWPGGPRRNVWLGTSCGARSSLWRIDALKRSAHLAELLFVSAEPLLEEIDLAGRLDAISWLIVGGESGPKARPFDPFWASRLLAQAQIAGVSFFMKQMGSNLMEPFNRCTECGWIDDIDGFDVGGADDGKLFCNRCQAEMDPPFVEFADSKGGDAEEWPERLRVREFPRALVEGGDR